MNPRLVALVFDRVNGCIVDFPDLPNFHLLTLATDAERHCFIADNGDMNPMAVQQ